MDEKASAEVRRATADDAEPMAIVGTEGVEPSLEAV